MKIDKVVFSCSELFSPWWNIQSKVWKTKFNVEPVCLLFGSKEKCGLSEKYGEIIEMPFDKDLPDIIQIQFSKFHHPRVEPEKTWIIGDIDQIPLQTEYFLNDLPNIPDDAYVHLNYTLTAQMRPGMRPDGMPGIPADTFLKLGSYVNGGYDLPGHYHVAKGSLYEKLFFNQKSFKDVVKSVMEQERHGMVKEDARRSLNKEIHGMFWVAEEGYTSEQIWYGLKAKKFSGFYGKEYHLFNEKIDRVGNIRDANGNWIPQWNGTNYVFDENKLRNKWYKDLHCHRPYHEQERPMMRILEIAEMI
jgi:hypothetical protein